MEFITYIENMSTPGKIEALLAMVSMINILFDKSENKLTNMIKIMLLETIYIFILNWLCNKNFCWASWSILIVHFVFYIVITLLFVFAATVVIKSAKS